MKIFANRKLHLVLAASVVINFLFIYARTPFENALTGKSPVSPVVSPEGYVAESEVPANNKLALYDNMQLGVLGLSRQAFEYAVKGYDYLRSAGKLDNDAILSIVDFSLTSRNKRLFVLDMKNNIVLFNTYVAHGRNSGREKATDFSNEAESNKSSLGFYVTGNTYEGKHGFSLRLLGEEKGINDNANSRAIVMHSAAYVSEGAIRMQGFIGRSLGCPALPEQLNKPIIETIKNGSCLFLYSPNDYYTSHSSILKKIS